MPKPEPKNSFTLPLESTKTILWASRNLAWNTASESLEQQNTGPKTSNSKTQAVALEAKSPKHHLDTSRKRPKPDPKNPVAKSGLRTPLPKASNNKTQAVALDAKRTPLLKASNNKTQAVALDAKSPKHHLDTSRKRPKPEPKNSFTLPFWASRNLALGTSLPKASNSKTQARKPRTAKHAAKLSRNLALETPLPKASNSKTQAVAVDAKSPKHHLGHEPKTAKTGAKKLFHVTFGIHNNNLLGLAKSRLEA